MAASRFAASRNRTHRNISTNNFHPSEINSLNIDNDNIHVHQNITDGFINNYNRFINERLRAIIIVSSSALTFMIIVVIICIIRTYLKNNYPISMTVTEQTTPLNPSRKTNKTVGFSQSNRDTKNFSRKSRTLPVNV
ncbi:unnamed protein product [Rotaria sp. Silwood2]|nr:unnamed protein product [Rotaria sp. Silwood2]CAF2568469.1 unnamed protein product [Rotaria sp. Silwood2]CAF2728025.1 unnamed protein product [Rotaria sp. Silwood2]CAF2962535.1 unnamed protein product [Rotaria sp. Silwood2]CAF4091765.1 unnamed protein product [Rotaria sp. Silwood2]